MKANQKQYTMRNSSKTERQFQKEVNEMDPDVALKNIGEKLVGKFGTVFAKNIVRQKITSYRIEGKTLFVTLDGIEVNESSVAYPIR